MNSRHAETVFFLQIFTLTNKWIGTLSSDWPPYQMKMLRNNPIVIDNATNCIELHTIAGSFGSSATKLTSASVSCQSNSSSCVKREWERESSSREEKNSNQLFCFCSLLTKSTCIVHTQRWYRCFDWMDWCKCCTQQNTASLIEYANYTKFSLISHIHTHGHGHIEGEVYRHTQFTLKRWLIQNDLDAVGSANSISSTCFFLISGLSSVSLKKRWILRMIRLCGAS